MQCPHCSSLCMEADLSCFRCGRSLPRGSLTPTRIANWTGAIFAILMFVFLVTVAIPRMEGSPPNDFMSIVANDIAMNMANYVFLFGAWFAGWVIGRVVGVVVCRAG